MDFDQIVEDAEDEFSAGSASRQATVSDVSVEPGPNDVLLGRGKGNERHPGNIRFRSLVSLNKVRSFLFDENCLTFRIPLVFAQPPSIFDLETEC